VETSGADPRVGALAGAATVVGLRLAALRLGWRLPGLKIRDCHPPPSFPRECGFRQERGRSEAAERVVGVFVDIEKGVEKFEPCSENIATKGCSGDRRPMIFEEFFSPSPCFLGRLVCSCWLG